MGRMIFDLPDEDRAALEALRRNRGHRSGAETLRELIRQAAHSGLPAPAAQAAIRAEATQVQAERFTIPRAAPGSRLKKR